MKLLSLSIRLSLFFLFAITVTAAPVTYAAHAMAVPRIVGGEAVSAGTYPWMVNLEFDGNFICGGSLIADKWVLTAAHCVTEGSAERYKVRVGVTDTSDALQGETRTVDKIIIHPDFSYDTLQNDIALVGFSTPVTATPVALMNTTTFETLTTGMDLSVAGWGATNKSGSTYPNILQQATVPLADHAACAADYAKGDITVTDKMVCAGGSETVDSCFGDSGGPLFLQTDGGLQQLGLVSFGASETCADGHAGVYTRIDAYANFIESITNGLLSTLNFGVLGEGHTATRAITFTNNTNAALTFTSVTNDLHTTVLLTQNTCLNRSIAAGDSCTFTATFTPNATGSVSGDITFNAATPLIYQVSGQVLQSFDDQQRISNTDFTWFSNADSPWQVAQLVSVDDDGSVQSGANHPETLLMAYYHGSGTLNYYLLGKLDINDTLALQVFNSAGEQVAIEYPTTAASDWTKNTIVLPEPAQDYTLVWRLAGYGGADVASVLWLDAVGKTVNITDAGNGSGGGALDETYFILLLSFWWLRRTYLKAT